MALIIVAAPARCLAHGHPAVVNVVPNAPGGKLTLSGGTDDPIGFAAQIFAETDSELWLFPATSMLAFTDAPGLLVNDLPAGAELFYEIIPRPDLTDPGRPQRWLWQWNPATAAIAPIAAQPTISLNPADDEGVLPTVTFGQSAPPPTNPIKIADVNSNDIGEHVHYVFYVLNHSTLVPDGVYGFFARLVSPGFEPSEPFLIALNLNVNALNYQEAALEINAAAGLAGDFDVDADVDGADFLLWQRTLNATGPGLPADASLNQAVDAADLAIWAAQFGRQAAIPTATSAAAPVPEPAAAALALALLAARKFAGIAARDAATPRP